MLRACAACQNANAGVHLSSLTLSGRRNMQVNSAVCDYIQQHVFIFIFSLASRNIRVHRHQGIRVAVVTSLVHPTKSSSVTFPYILNYRYFFYFFSYNTDFDCFTKTVCKRWT